jgi:hypothetical protein
MSLDPFISFSGWNLFLVFLNSVDDFERELGYYVLCVELCCVLLAWQHAGQGTHSVASDLINTCCLFEIIIIIPRLHKTYLHRNLLSLLFIFFYGV